MSGITRDDVQNFIPEFLRQLSIDMLVMGNVDTNGALSLGNMFLDIIKPQGLPLSMYPDKRVVRLNDGTCYYLQKPEPNKDNGNSAIYQYFQVKDNY